MKNLQSNISNREENKYKIKMLCGRDFAKYICEGSVVLGANYSCQKEGGKEVFAKTFKVTFLNYN